MLFVPPPDWSTVGTNVGSVFTDAGVGTSVTANASANVKGTNTALLTGQNYPRFGLGIFFSGGNTSAAIRRFMVDILVDPAAGPGNAGSTWSVLIPNLYVNSPAFASGSCGVAYWFPVFIGQGWAVGARSQCSTGGVAMRVVVMATRVGRPEATNFGTRVEAIGANTSTTTGVTVTPGVNAMGSYSASIGQLARDSFFFQLGIGSADTTITASAYLFDMAAGAGAQEYLVMQNMIYGTVGTLEQAYMRGPPLLPQRYVPAGKDLYARGVSCIASPDTGMDCVAYAVAI